MELALFTLLVADRSFEYCDEVKRMLEPSGYQVLGACSFAESSSLVHTDIAVAIVSLDLPGLVEAGGVNALAHILADIQLIVVSAPAQVKLALDSVSKGALWCLRKPIEREELLALVAKGCVLWELKRENAKLRSTLSVAEIPLDLTARSLRMREVAQRVAKLSNLDSPLLIVGESGTGKSMLARLIHRSSDRKSAPFVIVSCAAIPRDLLETELFGHERGAFSGAVSSRAGCIEMAQGGTLFLDEIGEMPLELQPKLLNFIQDRTYRRLGGTKVLSSNARLIFATNRDLEQMCQHREFREDLYFRINVLNLKLPPLRERPEDIAFIAQNYLDRVSAKRGVKPFRLTPAAIGRLVSYAWPGNVRELENVLERSTAFAQAELLDADDLEGFQNRDGITAQDVDPATFQGLSLKQIEKQVIVNTLARCGGNKNEAAKILGISLKSIYNKLK